MLDRVEVERPEHGDPEQRGDDHDSQLLDWHGSHAVPHLVGDHQRRDDTGGVGGGEAHRDRPVPPERITDTGPRAVTVWMRGAAVRQDQLELIGAERARRRSAKRVCCLVVHRFYDHDAPR
jgi:hypothetical protein